METMEEIALSAYVAYATHMDGRGDNGLPLQRWADLPARTREAWTVGLLAGMQAAQIPPPAEHRRGPVQAPPQEAAAPEQDPKAPPRPFEAPGARRGPP